MTIDKSWMNIRKRSSFDEFWNSLQNFFQMEKPLANDKGLIKCPCNRCVNNDRHQLVVLKCHIFRYGFMTSYDVWIYHGENANATVSSNVLE